MLYVPVVHLSIKCTFFEKVVLKDEIWIFMKKIKPLSN